MRTCVFFCFFISGMFVEVGMAIVCRAVQVSYAVKPFHEMCMDLEWRQTRCWIL